MKTMIGDVEKLVVGRSIRVRCDYVYDEHGKPVSCRVRLYDAKSPRKDDALFPANLLLAEGESFCHPKDNFWKKKGRHIAVCRAAKQLGVI